MQRSVVFLSVMLSAAGVRAQTRVVEPVPVSVVPALSGVGVSGAPDISLTAGPTLTGGPALGSSGLALSPLKPLRLPPVSSQLAVGTPGVYTKAFHRDVTNPRIAKDIEAGRYATLKVKDGRLTVETAGSALSPEVVKRIQARAAELPALDTLFDGADVVLIEAEAGSPEAAHPRLLAVTRKDYQIAHAGTRRGAVPDGRYAYMTAALFTDPVVPAEALGDLLREEVGHADARRTASREKAREVPEKFGDSQLASLSRLQPAISAEVAAVRAEPPAPAAVSAVSRVKGWLKAAAGLLRFANLFPEVIEPLYNYEDRNHFYSGTSFSDVVKIVRGGGMMKKNITYVSDEAGFPWGYARSAARSRGEPGLIFQFKPEIAEVLEQGHYQPLAPQPGESAKGLPVFYMANQDFPLSMQTDGSKRTILRWMTLQRVKEPEKAAYWDGLIREFEAAFQYTYRP